MRTLYLLRHAEAAAAITGQDDKTRSLTDKGRRDAAALGNGMAQAGMKPDYTICSAATRTRETMGHVLAAFAGAAGTAQDRLYNAAPGQLMAALREAPDTAESVLLVGHNPGIHQAALHLSGEIDVSAFEKLAHNYPPCTLTIFDCDCRTWGELNPGVTMLRDMIVPG